MYLWSNWNRYINGHYINSCPVWQMMMMMVVAATTTTTMTTTMTMTTTTTTMMMMMTMTMMMMSAAFIHSIYKMKKNNLGSVTIEWTQLLILKLMNFLYPVIATWNASKASRPSHLVTGYTRRAPLIKLMWVLCVMISKHQAHTHYRNPSNTHITEYHIGTKIATPYQLNERSAKYKCAKSSWFCNRTEDIDLVIIGHWGSALGPSIISVLWILLWY